MISYLVAESEKPSLWEEIWGYLYENYFSADSVYFENLNFGGGTMINIRNIILGLFIGVIIASVIMIIDKRVLGSFVRSLIKEECLSPDSAKTLADLGFAAKYTIRNGVRRSTALRSVVRCREEEEFNSALEAQRAEYEERRKTETELPPFKEAVYRPNPDTDHFYIPEEKKYSADMRFEKKGTSWLTLVFIIIALIFIFAILLFAIPELLKLLDSFAGSFGNTNNNILT